MITQLIFSDPGRWLRALLPINQFADKAAEVQGHIVRVRLLSEELLNKNVDTIKRSNDSRSQICYITSDEFIDDTRA